MTEVPAPAPIDALLAEARWLEGLARALVADREEARDLVQEVWAKAAARPPERLDAPRAWLATVLRNALRSRRRTERATEALHRHDVAPSPEPHARSSADVVARAEAQRALVESVLALDEPWRSTVLWHHFDGESCEAIARRTGVPPSTVRNRLAEARARLRERLARKRNDWMSALLPLATPPGASSGVSLTGPAIGGLAVSTSLKLVAAAAVVALGAWWGWGAFAPERTPAQEVVASGDAPGSAPERSAEASVPDAARANAVAEPNAPAGALDAAIAPVGPGELLVRVVEDGRPYASGGVARLGEGLRELFTARAELALAADGTARFAGVLAKSGDFVVEHVLEVELADGTRVRSPSLRMPEGAGREYVVRVGSARVFGTVWDSRGGPVAGATVELLCVATPPNEVDGGRSAITDTQGRYAIERVPAGPCHAHLALGLREDRGRLQRQEHPRFELAHGEARQLDFGAPNGWPAWTGRVLANCGAPTRDVVWVRVLGPKGDPNSFALQRCGTDGVFEVHVPPGPQRVEVRRDLDWAVLHQFDDVVVGATGLARDLVLPGARLAGRVFAADGEPLGSDTAELTISARIEGEDYPDAIQSWRVAKDGTFAIDALPPGTYVLGLHPLELAPESAALRVTIAEGDLEVRADVRLAPR